MFWGQFSAGVLSAFASPRMFASISKWFRKAAHSAGPEPTDGSPAENAAAMARADFAEAGASQLQPTTGETLAVSYAAILKAVPHNLHRSLAMSAVKRHTRLRNAQLAMMVE